MSITDAENAHERDPIAGLKEVQRSVNSAVDMTSLLFAEQFYSRSFFEHGAVRRQADLDAVVRYFLAASDDSAQTACRALCDANEAFLSALVGLSGWRASPGTVVRDLWVRLCGSYNTICDTIDLLASYLDIEPPYSKRRSGYLLILERVGALLASATREMPGSELP